jgi:aspartate-semialdehyde dehydrogenase
MTKNIYKVAIVGASSLAGKELSEALGESAFAASEFVLLDAEDAAGKLETVADDVTFIRKLEAESFDGADFVFFAGTPDATQAHWKAAQKAGASVVDMTFALEATPGVPVRAPWVAELLSDKLQGAAATQPDLRTPAVVAAHPAAVLLATVLAQLNARHKVKSASATVLEPASQYGRAAMDELHQQTVALLSFQPLPKDVYDAQAAFNIAPAMGAEAKVKLAETEQRIRRHYAALTGGALPAPALQLAHAASFHGSIASILVELEAPVSEEQMTVALDGEHVDVLLDENDPPSNLSVAGQQNIQVRVRMEPPAAEPGSGRSTQYWLWIAADNLKLAALNAIACGAELARLRPQGKVQ